eukprot:4966037-Pyramimonas_sp.AAC.1
MGFPGSMLGFPGHWGADLLLARSQKAARDGRQQLRLLQFYPKGLAHHLRAPHHVLLAPERRALVGAGQVGAPILV